MSSILHNVVVHQPEPRPAPGTGFRTISRTDGKTPTPSPVPPARPRPRGPARSGPNKCPFCGTHISDRADLFAEVNDLLECRVCKTKIDKRGSVVAFGVRE